MMGLAAETVRHFGRQRREAVGEMEGGGGCRGGGR